MSEPLPPPVTGAWLVHHEQKLSAVKVAGFDAIISAGRTARVLSLITRENDWDVPLDRVDALAKANQINRLELKASLATLREQGLIDLSDNGVAVLGVTQSMLLTHAATMFDAESPDNSERAAIALAEMASKAPVKKSECVEDIGDTFKIAMKDVGELLEQAEQIGFIDYDGAGTDKLYFNGSLFRRDMATKAALILSSLKFEEQARLATAAIGIPVVALSLAVWRMQGVRQKGHRHGCSLIAEQGGPSSAAPDVPDSRRRPNGGNARDNRRSKA
jgi:hypothetical protein